MATYHQRSVLDEQRLIEKHIDLDYDRYPHGRADVRLRDSGASVWAIVMFLDIYKGNRDELAQHFGISQEEIDAALAFYQRNNEVYRCAHPPERGLGWH